MPFPHKMKWTSIRELQEDNMYGNVHECINAARIKSTNEVKIKTFISLDYLSNIASLNSRHDQ